MSCIRCIFAELGVAVRAFVTLRIVGALLPLDGRECQHHEKRRHHEREGNQRRAEDAVVDPAEIDCELRREGAGRELGEDEPFLEILLADPAADRRFKPGFPCRRQSRLGQLALLGPHSGLRTWMDSGQDAIGHDVELHGERECSIGHTCCRCDRLESVHRKALLQLSDRCHVLIHRFVDEPTIPQQDIREAGSSSFLRRAMATSIASP